MERKSVRASVTEGAEVGGMEEDTELQKRMEERLKCVYEGERKE